MSRESKDDLVDGFTDSLTNTQTRRAYRADLRHFFGDSVGQDQIQGLTADDIQGFVQSLRDLGRKAGTQRRLLAALRSFFDWLITEGIHDRNPARHPDVAPSSPNKESTAATPLTTQELTAVLRVVSGPDDPALRDRALILTIVYGALRRSEVAGLKVGDLRPLGRHWILDLDDSAGKGGGYVRIPERLADILEQVRDTFDIAEGTFWRSLSNRSQGEPLSPSGIYRIVSDAGSRAGVGTVSIDRLRRTGLYLAIQGGASVAQVQAHGRYGDSSSVAGLSEIDTQKGNLSDSAVEYIDFDLERVVSSS